MHEEIRPGNEGIVNPGANLAPHPITLGLHHVEPGNHFVGSPTFDSGSSFVMHTDEDETAKQPPLPEKPADLPENTKDDRYQTHMVELTKDKNKEEDAAHTHNPNSLNVGKPVATEEAITPEKALALENPRPHNEAEVDKVLADHKHHREEAKEHPHEHPHDEHQTNELHTNEAHEPHYYDDNTHGDGHHNIAETSDDKINAPPSDVTKEENSAASLERAPTEEKVTEKPVERSGVIPKVKPSNVENDQGDKRENTNLVSEDHTVSKVEEIGKMLQNFDNVTKALSDNIIKNAEKIRGTQGTKKDSVSNDAETAEVRGNLVPQDHSTSKVKEIGKLLQNFDNVTKTLTDKIVNNVHRVTGTKKDVTFLKEWTQAQKDAYTQWRRKALINYHMRNPDKPIPRNTLSMSKNSLCPKFCRFFCDPWCVKIGCCTLSEEKLNIYKQIEQEQEKLHPGSKPDTRESKNCSRFFFLIRFLFLELCYSVTARAHDYND